MMVKFYFLFDGLRTLSMDRDYPAEEIRCVFDDI